MVTDPAANTQNAAKIWETALGALECQLSRPNFRTWYARTSGIAFEGGRFTIGAPNSFVAEYLEQNQRSLIEKTLMRLLSCNSLRVVFQVAGGGKALAAAPRGETTSNRGDGCRFNPRYDFDTFIVGNANRLAHAAALSAAQKPGEGYNPLFIHGGSGLGKTHLLQAIGQAAERAGKTVRYVSGEQFTAEFVAALKERRADDFRERYRAVDVLLVDDVQFIAGKTQTEESFFHTFNELHNSGRQIVLSADSPPRAILQMEDRLRSRFEWGLTAEIAPPDEKMRLSILKARAEEAGAELAPDVLDYMASEVIRNIRELEGNLNRVLAYAKLLRSTVTPDMARRALKNLSSAAVENKPTEPQLLLAAVAESFDLTVEDLLGRKRDKETAGARQVAMYVMKGQKLWSLGEIGKLVGDRTAATVSHACDKIANEVEYNPMLKRKLIDIENRLGGKS